MPISWLFALYLVERLYELRLAKRNQQQLEARGGRELYPESYRAIVAVHLLFWPALLAESWPWRVPLDLLTGCCLAALALLMALRYWCIVTLGPFWNTRVVILPGARLTRSGPYRWLRHPNYLVVTLEFIFLPLLMRAPYTLVLFSLLNGLVLRHRIAREEMALKEAAGCGDNRCIETPPFP